MDLSVTEEEWKHSGAEGPYLQVLLPEDLSYDLDNPLHIRGSIAESNVRQSMESFLIGLSFDGACFQEGKDGKRFCKICSRQFGVTEPEALGEGNSVGEEGILRGCCSLAIVCGECIVTVSLETCYLILQLDLKSGFGQFQKSSPLKEASDEETGEV